MKLYKKYEKDSKYMYLHDLAKDYLIFNNIKVKFYAWHGMCNDYDFVKTDKGILCFNIGTKKLVKEV